MIHTTIGVYANGEMKKNGVPSENLANHIQYNLVHRPGRAFFLDGVCLNKGYLSIEKVEELEAHFSKNPYEFIKDTQPYI